MSGSHQSGSHQDGTHQSGSHPPHDDPTRPSLHEQAERFSRKVTDSAQQVWLAGLGALGRAQTEGSRLFDSLVHEGEEYEARNRTTGGTGSVRENVEEQLHKARDKASSTWERAGKVYDDQVQAVLQRLHVPTAQQVTELQARIDALTTRLNHLESRQQHADAAASGITPPPSFSTGGTP